MLNWTRDQPRHTRLRCRALRSAIEIDGHGPVTYALRMVYAWPYALFFWTAFVWAFAPEFRVVSKRQDRTPASQDRNSKALIMIGQGAGLLAAFAIARTMPAAALSNAAWWFWIGLAALVAGSLLRRHCFRMLGASFTGDVIVRPEQTVVERGAYRYVRHPSYTAGFLMFLGIALALGNWIGIAMLCGVVALVYGYRVSVEERALADTIGEPYRIYMNRTKRFVPFVY